ncbi:DUF1611 domain-containing protein [Haliovirga abyssi]|uniref:D-glutamate N-acetyltransferase-like C-terminal domain-containing protein n=1 Tax=Haliovirga abyssi TaxID=2996794 RepID=A0AAU9DRJ6_9FUSO|nr:DUF1611 domain-containing protein [Haliovirga abyssi]BDU51208.1 hypothetical protein HLVA_17770 [Haliovirga abyssi]
MKKVCIYPFNKVTHGLVRFKEMLDFEITSIIDFNFDIGKDAGEMVNGKKIGVKITDNVEKALETVDTLILNDPGIPMKNFEEFYESKNLREKWLDLIKVANLKNIKIISTFLGVDILKLSNMGIDIDIDCLERKKINQFVTKVLGYKKKSNNKKIQKIGIFGTKSCIGKFTAQMNLYKELSESEKVDIILTEPTGRYFKKPQIANMKIGYKETEEYLKALIKEYEYKGIEYLIFADQGGVGNTDNLEWSLSKITLLKGLMPDKYILVAGYDDDMEIRKAIDLIKIYTDLEKPFAILLPDKIEKSYGKYEKINEKQIDMRKKQLKDKFEVENVELIKEMYKIKNKLLKNKFYNEAMRGKKIKKAVLYPYNKIARGILRASEELNLWYEITGVIDFDDKIIGQDAKKILNLGEGLIVTDNVEKAICGADTVIFTDSNGIDTKFKYKHEQLKTKEKFSKVMDISLKNKKNIYVIDSDIKPYISKSGEEYLEENNIFAVYPEADITGYNEVIEEKEWEYKIKTPVIGIFGTSPHQGKLTTQLFIKKVLMEKGLKIGHIGTEPSSYLLGCEEMWTNLPKGINSELGLYRYLLKKTDKKGYDCLIVGGQSGITPFKLNVNSNSLTLPSIVCLFVANPDIYILVVNHIDPIEHIKNSINTLEALGKKKVIALVLPDIKAVSKDQWQETIYEKVTLLEMEEKKKELFNKFMLPVIDINNSEDIKILGDIILNKLFI